MNEADVMIEFGEDGQRMFVLSCVKTPQGYLYQIEQLADDGELIEGFKFMNGELIGEGEEGDDEWDDAASKRSKC